MSAQTYFFFPLPASFEPKHVPWKATPAVHAPTLDPEGPCLGLDLQGQTQLSKSGHEVQGPG